MGDAAVVSLAMNCAMLSSLRIGYSSALTDKSFKELRKYNVKANSLENMQP
jgi:hypothetical protein